MPEINGSYMEASFVEVTMRTVGKKNIFKFRVFGQGFDPKNSSGLEWEHKNKKDSKNEICFT